MPQAREELADLVAIRSVADPRQFPPEECARAATRVRDKFAEVGFSDTRLVETADGSRAVVGSRPAPDSLVGDGSVSDMLWARPSVTVPGIECPPVVGSAAAIVPRTAARLNLRIPLGSLPTRPAPSSSTICGRRRPGGFESRSMWRRRARRSRR